ncbi:DUF2062 domain-containing protein [Desulfococcus multivorans]|jgi:uncharacterized protein (DUF2062 family)|uniref:DUF2062 domain-containing protein n=1 Tax=Desulfococcus multivorans DSM 2059 TaxID=1121405 RepID=S7TXL2_DESML|nr:DUF2062 domain-containing protein [Desulfococcus multivorans]AOY57093.1 conserved uncharacterized protein, DUF2062 [Desulfococcus multivorans]AQU99601.1 hypothetical protein B2D07_01575 [Desulfococcus multivorans]EPR41801.1 Protein of unknown function DUF2062 [Desulfococcus multivorans DSM 2059]MDX9818551.1 DUF2062 domain-containing protein [Desulfococcus multivorans]SJZ87732.1 hypothetical protein SAMN02745446_01932 [Desulfococcus multivorans DSM 2059]
MASKEKFPTHGLSGRIIPALKKAYDRFVKIRGNPKEIALGFALGLFVGMTPYMGLHMAIAVFLAALFKWNKIAAATGAWISNPLTAPFIYAATFYVGNRILSIDNPCCLPGALNLDVILQLVKNAPAIFWILTVGGIVLGVPVALIGYYMALSMILKYREGIREKLIKEKEKITHPRRRP